jgi:hypothetical protein
MEAAPAVADFNPISDTGNEKFLLSACILMPKLESPAVEFELSLLQAMKPMVNAMKTPGNNNLSRFMIICFSMY